MAGDCGNRGFSTVGRDSASGTPGHRRHAWLAAVARSAVVATVVTTVICAVFGCEPRFERATVPPVTSAAVTGDAAVIPVTAGGADGALPLVPRPTTVQRCEGAFTVDARVVILPNHPAAYESARLLGGWLGLRVVDAIDGKLGAVIEVKLEGTPARDPSVNPPKDVTTEGYTIEAKPGRVVVKAHDLGGLFYGVQTLAQLAEARAVAGQVSKGKSISVPCVSITDAPRFPIRAMHLDVVRHFFDAATVERYVDIIAFYKFNVFHWHLTDDQGFRLPLRGLETTPAYTKDDVARVVAYAKTRGITVVPEIEMPGHVRAILAKRPELSCTGKALPLPEARWGVFPDILCAGNPATTQLLDELLGDVSAMFPSSLVHVGGDEAPKDRWNACPKCRAAMAHDHTDAKGLENRLFAHVGATLAGHGKRMLAWDDALDSIPAGGIAVAWQNRDRGAAAAKAGHDVILAPSQTTYFNFWQSRTGKEPGHEGYIPWTDVLAFDPMPEGLSPEARAHVLGGEGALWTEYVTTQEQLDTLLAPRIAALAEALWSTPEPSTFPARFTAQRSMLDGVAYFVEPPIGLRRRSAFVDSIAVDLKAPALFPDGVVRYTTDGSDPTATSPIFSAVSVRATTTIAARTFLPNGRSSPVIRGEFEKQSLRAAETVTVQPGIDFDYLEGTFKSVPTSFAAAKVHGHLPALGFDKSFRAENFAVRYRGFVEASGGILRIITKSDDGIIVDIGDKQVVSDDGAHAAREADGEIALAKGWHPITIRYFQGGGGKSVSLLCEDAAPRHPCALATAR